MKLYQRIVAYELMAIVGLGVIGCDPASNQQKPVEPRYISGTIKSEKYKKNWIDPDRYFFALSTEDGLKMFECYEHWGAQKRDMLLNPKNRVKFKISEYQRDRQNNFSVSLNDIVEVDGEPFSY
ncbi:hypothetical protein HY772_06755 [Candidatus Woesearchaeota archaeon]|nr:hypothetical protein [Candidatus Woesearchaeota archaeon]